MPQKESYRAGLTIPAQFPGGSLTLEEVRAKQQQEMQISKRHKQVRPE